MAINAQKYLPPGYALSLAINDISSFLIMFKAGCASDSDCCSSGDQQYSLPMECLGLLLLVPGADSDGAAIGLESRSIDHVRFFPISEVVAIHERVPMINT
jgi:hypothetical protein